MDYKQTASDFDIREYGPPSLTTEQWLDAQGYGGQRPTNCLYHRLQLTAAGKGSAKLDAVEVWMNQIIAVGAQDPDAQHADLPAAPYTFAETSQEAIAALAGGA
mgnify:CR=1 FL=1